MSNLRPLLMALACAALLPACASRNGGAAGGPGGEGIRTSSIRSAPASRQAVNNSRPLSELNTPEAIAARQASGQPVNADTAVAPAPRNTAPQAAQRSAVAETEALLANPAASTPPRQASALQKGGKVRVREGGVLRARPAAGSDALVANLQGELELGPQVYNADGYWWYVTAGAESGWLSQKDILR